jgi:signal transduction histidine kinase/heme/copper-type cytochrome/quinol oxidase subunit 2
MKIFRDYATKTAVIYAIIGLCWIFFSDSILELVTVDIGVLTEIGSWKGAAFVLVSAFVIYFVALDRDNKDKKQNRQLNIGKTSLVLVFAALAIIIVLIGVVSASYIAKNEKQKSINHLTTVAHLKADELKRWLNERIGDAEFLRSATFFIKPQGDWKKRTDEETKKKVTARLEDLRRASGYYCVFLADEHGNTLLSTGKCDEELTPALKDAIKKALQTNQTTFTDIYRIDKTPFIDFTTPTKAPKGTPKTVVVARVNANSFLYPYLQSWPVSSNSAETLLFEQDGDNVLFLNELRHKKNTALELKISLKQKNLLVAQALDKNAKLQNPIEGIDYRGIGTIGVAQKIEGTNWFLMSKQDKSEIYAEAKQAATWIGIADALTIIIAAGIMLLVHQKRELQFARMRHEEQAEKLEERKIAEEKINELNHTLEQKVIDRTIELKNAYDEMEAFTYSVSHDLRSPLRATDGFSQAILEDYYDKLDEQGKDYLLRIRHASQKMESLIDDLLKLSRLTRHEMLHEDVNLSQMAQDIFKELIKNHADIQVDIQEGMIERADPDLIQIALTNLISNALKFTSTRENAHISFGVTKQNGKKIYYIKDNGAGFDMAYAQHLFKPFYRLHTSQEFDGSGIGLAIVYRVITRHFGKIWAEGEVGKGATFFFTLNAK